MARWQPVELLKLTAGMSKEQAYTAAVPSPSSSGLFPACTVFAAGEAQRRSSALGCHTDEQRRDRLWQAVDRDSLRLMFYTDDPKDEDAHCSFYIGIFSAGGFAWHTPKVNSSVLTSPLQLELEHSAEAELWVIGEGAIGTVFSSEGVRGDGTISWVRLRPPQTGKQAVLSRAGALTIMSTLVGPEERLRSKRGK